MVELDPKYVDTTVDRWQRFTGERARHAETGDPFSRTDEQVAVAGEA